MFKGILIRLRPVVFLVIVLAVALGSLPLAVAAQENAQTAASALPAPAMVAAGDVSGPYFSVEAVKARDGKQLDRITINGPAKPPPGFDLERAPVSAATLSAAIASSSSLVVPAYNWVFGCSAVSASMIAAYFDRTGYPNMYTGPTNGGVMPLDNSVWPYWTDTAGTSYPGNPLTASRNGQDGRLTRGSIDDYWVSYSSSAQDPYINHWAQHAWGDAIGDYMKTSQSTYGNTDGATTFYGWSTSASPLTCAQMEGYNIANQDGTYGRKLFYQARGYTVTDCYSQKTDNTITGGFSYANYKAQIDAGHPVFLNLAGHSIVGVGYADPSTVYIHDTWDYSTHQMTWGGSYAGMALQSVSIVNLSSSAPLPAISINDVSVTEGNSGTTTANFTVSLSAPSSSPVSVAWATANGTATAGSDYVAGSGTVTFPANTTTQPIGVVVNGDTTYEPNETFYVNLSSPSGATIADGQGVGTIVNDDSAPALTLHVGNLAGSAKTGKNKTWTATVVVTVLDGSGKAASGATVTARWSTDTKNVTCKTGAAGTCKLSKSNIPAATASVKLAVVNLAKSGYTYASGQNVATEITVAKP